MDKVVLGQRIAQARDASGMTQAELGSAVGLDRSAVSRLEKAERKLNVSELVAVAAALGRPLAYFVSEPVPAVASRRTGRGSMHSSSALLDAELESLAGDIRVLLHQGIVSAVARPTDGRTPKTHPAAENYASALRKRIGLDSGPVEDLIATCESLGLYTLSASLGVDGPDGGCVEVHGSAAVVGVAVVNGDAPPGRRRMTLAHELGHWLFGDAYDAAASLSNEQMIDSFAIHFLAPRAGVGSVWANQTSRSPRDRALHIAATYKLSWSAAVSQLRNLKLISHETREALLANEPRQGDYVRLGLRWAEELRPPSLSPGISAAILTAYASERLTAARTLELLRGTLTADELPERGPRSLASLRPSFAGHGW